MKRFRITACRTSRAFNSFHVTTDSLEEAKQEARKLAEFSNFSDFDAEYSVTDFSEFPESEDEK